VLVVPSPKFHCQEVGVPAVVSANWTVSPGPGVAGLNTKVALDVSGMMVTVRLALLLLAPAVATSDTFLNPEAV
jgi:hypothetical protein